MISLKSGLPALAVRFAEKKVMKCAFMFFHFLYHSLTCYVLAGVYVSSTSLIGTCESIFRAPVKSTHTLKSWLLLTFFFFFKFESLKPCARVTSSDRNVKVLTVTDRTAVPCHWYCSMLYHALAWCRKATLSRQTWFWGNGGTVNSFTSHSFPHRAWVNFDDKLW